MGGQGLARGSLSPEAALLVFAVAAGVFPFLPTVVGHVTFLPHHAFEARAPIGFEDLVDLLTPFVVVGAAALALVALRPSAPAVAVAVFAAVTYVAGHGMHLAANSIAQHETLGAEAARVAHFWDERLSHLWWHAGLLGLLAAFSLAAGHRDVRGRWAAGAIALLGPGLFLQSVEGGTWWLVVGSLPLFVVAATRRPAHGTVVSAAVVAVAALGIAFWAAWWRGLPQPSDFV